MSDESANVLRHQRPVLMIGLGGTGKQVLLNLRRQFFDHYGTPTLPHIGHIWIDTDQSNMTLDGEDMNFLLKEVDFDATERVNTELHPADLQNYYEHKTNHPHIFSWFDTSLEKHGRIESGAGGIRCFGRLAFFHHYQDIMGRIRDKYSDIRNAAHHATLLETHGIHVDASKVDTWLIFSIAGGTGSGMFLDMAFALKENDPNTRLRSMILLPSVFSADFQHRIFGNAYAALMELEHYNFAKGDGTAAASAHRFPVAWTREQYSAGQYQTGPVFDIAYVIGNRPSGTGGTLALKDKNSLCEMLAEALFIDHGGATQALAAEWASKRSNFADSLAGTIRHEYGAQTGGRKFAEEYCCRYGSLGLSKLHIPVQRIASLVRHKLAMDLVEHWLRARDLPPNFDDLIVREYLPRLQLGERGKDGNFYRELRGGGSGPSTEESLHEVFARERHQFVQNAAQPNIGERIQAWLKDAVLIGLLDNTNPDRSRWGSLTRLVVSQHSEDLYAKVAAELDAVTRELLAAPTQRIPIARELLRRVSALLDKQRVEFDALVERARQAAVRNTREMSDRLAWLADCPGLRTRRAIVGVALEFAEDRAAFELRAQICLAAAKVSERLVDLIGRGTLTRDAKGQEILVETGLLKQLGDLEKSLERDVRATLNGRVDGLRSIQTSAINQNLYEEHDFLDFYVTADGRRIDETALIDLDRRFFEDADPGRPKSLWELRQALQTEGARPTIDALLSFSRSMTRHLEDKTVDVLERLSRQTPAGTPLYGATLQRLIDYGQPWLAPPTHFTDETSAKSNVVTQIMVAVSRRTAEQVRSDFTESLRQKWHQPLAHVDSTPDRVYVSSERVAFPLMAIPDLDRYRNASYYPHLQRGIAVHTDANFEKFQDLLLKRQEEVEVYLQALETLAKGIVSGVVAGVVRAGAGGKSRLPEYSFRDRGSLFHDDIPLGGFSLAVRKLCTPDGTVLAEAIRTATTVRLRNLDDTELGRWIYLLHHAARYNPIGHPGLSAVFAALAEEEQHKNPGLVQQVRLASETVALWSAENPPGSGFRCLPALDGVLV
jgi:hypothetical protein